MTENANGIDENYKTLACDVALFAFNDMITDTIDLICLEEPWANKYTLNRYNKYCDSTSRKIRHNRRKSENITDAFIGELLAEEIEWRKKILKDDLKTCKDFFLDPNPLAAAVGATGAEIIEQYKDRVKEWLENGKIQLFKTTRHNNGYAQAVYTYGGLVEDEEEEDGSE